MPEQASNHEQDLSRLLTEERIFQPPADFAANAVMRDASVRVRIMSEDLSEIVAENRDDLRAGVVNMKDASELLKGDIDQGIRDIDKLIKDLDLVVAENRRDVRHTVANFRAASETLKAFGRALEERGLLGVARGLEQEKKEARWPWDEERDEP